VASIAYGDVPQAAVDEQVYERGRRQDAVSNEILTKPVKHGADECTDDDDRQPHLRIEVFSDVEIGSTANRTCVDS